MPEQTANTTKSAGSNDQGQQFLLRPDVQVSQTSELTPAPGFRETTLDDGGIGLAEPIVVLLEPEVHRWVEIVEAGGDGCADR